MKTGSFGLITGSGVALLRPSVSFNGNLELACWATRERLLILTAIRGGKFMSFYSSFVNSLLSRYEEVSFRRPWRVIRSESRSAILRRKLENRHTIAGILLPIDVSICFETSKLSPNLSNNPRHCRFLVRVSIEQRGSFVKISRHSVGSKVAEEARRSLRLCLSKGGKGCRGDKSRNRSRGGAHTRELIFGRRSEDVRFRGWSLSLSLSLAFPRAGLDCAENPRQGRIPNAEENPPLRPWSMDGSSNAIGRAKAIKTRSALDYRTRITADADVNR